MAKPDYRAYTVRETEKGSFWVTIGAAWKFKESDGLKIKLDALPVNGEIILRAPQDTPENIES
jgi:hypothetical protein